MTRFAVICAIMIYGPVAWAAKPAASSKAFICRTTNKVWVSLISVDAVGKGTLIYRKKGETKDLRCDLKVTNIQNEQRAISPNFTLELSRTSCVSEVTPTEFLDSMKVIIKTKENPPKSIVQWLKTEQPDACKIEKINLFDLAQGAKKWNY